MWILDNSIQLKTKLAECNDTQYAECISTWDFSTLYTTIPHNIQELINFAYKTRKMTFIAVSKYNTFWFNKETKNYTCFTSSD